jgi:hypothetical protein
MFTPIVMEMQTGVSSTNILVGDDYPSCTNTTGAL